MPSTRERPDADSVGNTWLTGRLRPGSNLISHALFLLCFCHSVSWRVTASPFKGEAKGASDSRFRFRKGKTFLALSEGGEGGSAQSALTGEV